MNRLKSNKGFTLLEMIIAVAVLGVLSSMITVASRHARERARLAVFYTDIRWIKLAAGRFEADCGFYPLDVWRNVDPGLVEKYGWKDGEFLIFDDTYTHEVQNKSKKERTVLFMDINRPLLFRKK